ncbi:MAG: DUF4012 domain-containing protein [Patescibacteria group bacterium]
MEKIPEIRSVDTPAKVIGPKRRRNRKPLYIGLFVVIVILLIVGGYSTYQARRLYQAGMALKNDATKIQQNIADKKYTAINDNLNQASEHITLARAASDGLWPIKWLPYVHTQFQVVDQLLLASDKGIQAGKPLVKIIQEVDKLVGDKSTTANKIGKAEREAFLKTISESPDTLTAAQSDLQASVTALQDLPDKGVIGPLAIIVSTIKTNLPNIEAAVNKGLPFLTVAPTIAGYPDSKTYLFLLQNNTELRPTGGFIGTYGILQLKSGNIEEFKTDNIYNIDNKVKYTWSETPPEPLQKYLDASRWYLRDSNWDPDFPTSAARAEDFYTRESQSTTHIDGVIAVTPEVIHDLLVITGPIVIDGDEYNADNLTEKLQYQVEIAYYKEGVSDAARKAVIGKLAAEIMNRVMNLPQSDWGKLGDLAITNFEEKHLLVYSNDAAVQNLMHQIGWDGSVTVTDNDYLMVIDANLAAKKTDRVMTKTIDYTVTKVGDHWQADIVMHYKNDGVFDDFTTRYRSYTRIYAPIGSELLSSEGFLTNDRYLGGDPVAATSSEDEAVHKTVFGGFISVEPKTEDTIKLSYRLPERIGEQIMAGTYQLTWQKQPGTNNVTATMNIDAGRKVLAAQALDETVTIDNTKVHLTMPLWRDVVMTVDYK